jgi:hypothetical protein
VLPFAAPLLLGTVAKSVAIEVTSHLNMLQSLQKGCCNKMSLCGHVLYAY